MEMINNWNEIFSSLKQASITDKGREESHKWYSFPICGTINVIFVNRASVLSLQDMDAPSSVWSHFQLYRMNL